MLSKIEPPFSPMRGQSLVLQSITHRFGDAVAVDDVSLSISPGEFVVFLGPSGCGKTTLLRAIAGFVDTSEGAILIGGHDVAGLTPAEREVGIVFQSYALFPHMTVRANVAYGLRARRWCKQAIRDRVDEMLHLVRIADFADRYPNELSGGQQQRVALARSLAVNPGILLLDEPFGALDKNLRLDMQIEVKRIQREAGLTAVMVTHDQEEALSMADRIAVFARGRLEQFGSVEEIYDRPTSEFVAGFVGHTNLLPATLGRSATGGALITLRSGDEFNLPKASPCAVRGKVVVSIRPENLALIRKGNAQLDDQMIHGVVSAMVPLGPMISYSIVLSDNQVVKVMQLRQVGTPAVPGDEVCLTILNPSLCPVYLPY